MINIEIIKKEIKENKIRPFYIFVCKDYGIIEDYIKVIEKNKSFDCRAKYFSSINSVTEATMNVSLFGKEIIVCSNDYSIFDEKSKKDKEDLKSAYTSDKNKCVILVYKELSEKQKKDEVLKDYITEIPELTTEISEYIISKIVKEKLEDTQLKALAKACKNNYGLIKLEINKLNYLLEEKRITELKKEELETILTFEKVLINDFDLVLAILKSDLYNTRIMMKKGKIENIYNFINNLTQSLEIVGLLSGTTNKPCDNVYNKANELYKAGYHWGKIKVLRDEKIRIYKEYTAIYRNKIEHLKENYTKGMLNEKQLICYILNMFL